MRDRSVIWINLFQRVTAENPAHGVEPSLLFARTRRGCAASSALGAALQTPALRGDDANAAAGRTLPYVPAVFRSFGVESRDRVLTGSGSGEKFIFMDINRTLGS